MRKRTFFVAAALLAVFSQGSAQEFFDRWSFRLSPGGAMPIGGQYSDAAKLRKAVNIGAGLTGGLRYRVSDYFYVGADYGFTWMRAKDEYRPFDYKETEPALNVMMLTINSTLILSTGFGINPYITLGGGLYPWRFSQEPLWGPPWPAPADPTRTFAMNSFGLNTGIGVQKNISSRLAIFIEVMYHYVFSRNPERFGTDDFNEQDFLGLNLGLSFGFGKR
jgi:opacity protein-like surface antigen